MPPLPTFAGPKLPPEVLDGVGSPGVTATELGWPREDDRDQSWRDATGGLSRPCHLGTAQTDAAWVPRACHLRATLPAMPLRLQESLTFEIAGPWVGVGSAKQD